MSGLSPVDFTIENTGSVNVSIDTPHGQSVLLSSRQESNRFNEPFSDVGTYAVNLPTGPAFFIDYCQDSVVVRKGEKTASRADFVVKINVS